MKNKLRSFIVASLTVAGFGLIASSIGGSAKADQWDKMTIVTLNERMIAGNKVLEPGTYVWKLLDSPSDRHVVQIFNGDQSHLYETILAIPNYRLQPTGDSRFAFYETPPGVPKAVRAWFYPGDNFGQEFKYPKKLIAQLASAVPAPLPMNYKEEPQPVAEPAPAAPTPAPEPTPPVEPTPAPEPQPTPQADTTPAPAPATLPHTGSNVPLIALFGIASLGLASVLSLKAKRT
jgi:LPXTG-motif cell wall-anchored protein